jgi:hypothetical protein
MVKLINKLVALAVAVIAICGLTSASTLSFDHYWTFDEVCDLLWILGIILTELVTEL